MIPIEAGFTGFTPGGRTGVNRALTLHDESLRRQQHL
jgi:hypothetical protein